MDFTNPSHRLGFAVAVIIIVALGAALYLGKEERSKPDTEAAAPQTVVPATVSAEKETAAESQKKEINGGVLRTSQGDIEVTFFRDKAPKTVENFVKLAESGFYNGTKFHRVIKDFMIQGGDPLSKDDTQMGRWGTGGPGYQFADESNSEKIVRGVLAMANSGPNTNGSQFFIVTAEATPWLDGRHTVFGRVVKGTNVVDAISAVPTGERDMPQTPVVIERITLK